MWCIATIFDPFLWFFVKIEPIVFEEMNFNILNYVHQWSSNLSTLEFCGIQEFSNYPILNKFYFLSKHSLFKVIYLDPKYSNQNYNILRTIATKTIVMFLLFTYRQNRIRWNINSKIDLIVLKDPCSPSIHQYLLLELTRN